ncbi:PQQ-dependent catabolism-associated CXXCW motif protein [Methylobacterium oryzisoli]|uniref:PQQ-dependent catabolism-associated CXXCW motif protein n=1 Tax=Methylobacterium oryzisoli TaxID=3385502 RepID=UPI003891CACC
MPAVRAAALALAALLSATAARAGAPPPEPSDYREDQYRAPTPATLAGARVIGADEAEALWRQGTLFIDVMPRPPRPAQLPPGTIWRDPPHESIPNAHWLANTGFGGLAPETEAYFRSALERLTGGDRARPMVFFCLRHCWMSWNAAKRALALGYTRVIWFPDGTDGWSDAALPLERLQPEK